MFKTTTQMHGNICVKNLDWDEPVQVTSFDVNARDYGLGIKAHEFNDTPETLRKKVDVLAQLITEAQHAVAYTGAGISTAAGIDDYATKAKQESVTAAGRPVVKDWKMARPTLTHRVLTAMHFSNLLPHWIQQNHDSLPQKAGYPQEALNEIHGSLHDPANPIVPYEGTLRDDLFEWMQEEIILADLCLALGTSMSGFNCDQVPATIAERTNGLVIVNLQQTSYDDDAALRIYAKTDDVFRLLAARLGLKNVKSEDYVYSPEISPDLKMEEDVYLVPFDVDGNPLMNLTDKSKMQQWDLRIGARVRLTGGPYAGDIGVVVSKNNTSGYRIRFANSINPTFNIRRRTFSLWMGPWWIEMATRGKGIIPGGRLPFVNVGEDVNEEVEEKTADVDLTKYNKLRAVGLNVDTVRHKMMSDGLNDVVIEEYLGAW